jgi:hypothetical protein
LAWKDIHRELKSSRKKIQDELNSPVNSFAYPYAFPQEDPSFVEDFRKQLVDTGYRVAVTTVVGSATKQSDPLCLSRLPFNECDDKKLFESKLAGDYDWMARLQSTFRRLKSLIK